MHSPCLESAAQPKNTTYKPCVKEISQGGEQKDINISNPTLAIAGRGLC